MNKCKICGAPVYFNVLYHPDCVDMELEKLREENEGLKNTCDQWSSICDSLYLSNQRMGEALKAYSAAEAEGRLLVLPCKMGDTLYRIRRFKRGKNWTKEAVHILTTSLTINNVANILFGGVMGKTVFLTREEAEATLKNRKEK